MKRFACALFAAGSLAALAQAPTTPVAAAGPALRFTVKEGLATPESVFFDAVSETYLVSNINGAPLAKDNNGYVTELSTDGTVLVAKLVAGGERGATLHAPKGLVVHAGTLYVADIDTVRLFDRKTGAVKGEIKVTGATFVNDLSLGPDGRLYLTDSGLDAKFAPTGTDGLYVIELGARPVLKTLVKSKALHQPNGVLATKDAVYVVTFGAAELQKYDLKGRAVGAPTVLPKGSLDGLVAVGDEFIISSWEGAALYRGRFGGPFTAVVSQLKAPADLGYDPKRTLVLVPRFEEHRVEAWTVE